MDRWLITQEEPGGTQRGIYVGMHACYADALREAEVQAGPCPRGGWRSGIIISDVPRAIEVAEWIGDHGLAAAIRRIAGLNHRRVTEKTI